METATRAVYRGQVTKLAKAASDYLQSEGARANAENLSRFDEIEEEIAVLVARLTAANESLTKANCSVQANFKADDFEGECQAIADYDDKAIAAIARLNRRIFSFRELQRAAEPLPSSNASGNAIRPAKVVTKLPNLQLKKFSGNFEDWLPFWEQFKTSIHENESLSSSGKFNYLESVLTGKAAESIKGYTSTPSCYDAVISMLQEEYGDTEKLVDKNMQVLMSLPNVSSRHDVAGLRRLYNAVTSSTRSLTALGIHANNYSVMLKCALLKCFPKELALEYHRTHTSSIELENHSASVGSDAVSSAANTESSVEFSGDKQIRSILIFLKREVQSLERITTTTTRCSKEVNEKLSTSAGLLTQHSESSDNQCLFCKSKSHSTKQCKCSLSIQKKKEMLKSEGHCFKCTKRGHNSKFCRNKFILCDSCHGCHATSMCDPNYSPRPPSKPLVASQQASPSSSATDSSPKSVNLLSSSPQLPIDIYLQTACAFAFSTNNNSSSAFIRLILDGGSQRSYIRECLSKKLDLEIVDKVRMRILPFGKTELPSAVTYNRVRVRVRSQYDNKDIVIIAVEVPEICIDVLPVPTDYNSEFAKFKLADNRSGGELEPGINLLIGADYYWSVTYNRCERINKSLTSISTMFGWTIQGPFIREIETEGNLNLLVSAVSFTSSITEEANVERFWDLESLGISNCDSSDVSINDVYKYITKQGPRYEASLIWKNEDGMLDNYKNGASIRFEALVKKLIRDPGKLLEYDALLREYYNEGIIEKVDAFESNAASYYMPHRPIYREDKTTTKTRIVFDASAHSKNNLSLNAYLSPGPNLLPDILNILLNFRLGEIGLVADIEKAFLQILLKEQDRNYHRFFWFDKPVDDVRNLPVRSEYRMTRVTFGITCSPVLLNATLRKHLDTDSSNYPTTCEVLKKSFYMDDLILSVHGLSAAEKIVSETRQIMKNATMNIRKWNSNNEYLRSTIMEEAPSVHKVLGVVWNCLTDEISVNLDENVEYIAATATKRNLLQFIAKIYDPLGILGPYVVRLKILFQEVWRLKVGWDDVLTDNLLSTWNDCIKHYKHIKEIFVPRYIFNSINRTSIQLHLFADASLLAYGVVAYVRSQYEDGSTAVRYLCSKNRVAPLKESGDKSLTLPKLELTAALLAARLCRYVISNLNVNFNSSFLWSDSRIALYWIEGDPRRWKPYVTHRVNEIRCLTSLADWNHCPGDKNPADLLTRGVTGKKLRDFSEWLHGPNWLAGDPRYWPRPNEELDDVSISFLSCLHSAQNTTSNVNAERNEGIFKIENFSSYRRLLRVTAYVKRFVNLLRKKNHLGGRYLTADELQQAETYWIKYTQGISYQDEINALRNKKPISNASTILTLNPVLDEVEIIRVASRVQQSGFNLDVCFPIILPKCSHLTTLIVRHTHNQVLHGGVNVVLTRIRERFWIIKARQLIKSIVNHCGICKRLKGKAATQPLAPLPRSRLVATRPFESTGVDFAGPLYVKDPSHENVRRKIYVMLFTCGVVRAVHTELVNNLSTESCILAMRRFIARRGLPKLIISDNAKTFKRAAQEFKAFGDIIFSEEVQSYASNSGINWQFIVERAPWWGGFYERLVKSVKDVLRATIGRNTLTTEQLETTLTEAEAVINARPMTYISDDATELNPLTPAHFLAGTYSTINTEPAISTHAEIQSKWKARLRSTKQFWKRFKTEYVQQLRSAHNNHRQFSSSIKEGDVVLVYDQATPRVLWKLAIIQMTYPGRDGKIRACLVRFSNGTQLRRPIQLLYPLEVNPGPEDVENTHNEC